jgi:hypothetical protein
MITRLYSFVFVLFFATAATVSANFADFGAQLNPGDTDVPVMMADFSGGMIRASVASSFEETQPRWMASDISFDNPAFTNMFGTTGNTIQVISQADPSRATRIDFSIDQPFPVGTRLVVFDMDGIQERVTVASASGGTFAPPVQLESNTGPGANGVFPSSLPVWNPATSQLQSTGLNNGQNNREAAIFDIEGLDHVAVTISAGELASSWVGIATVPEPGTSSMVFLALVSLGMLRRRNA